MTKIIKFLFFATILTYLPLSLFAQTYINKNIYTDNIGDRMCVSENFVVGDNSKFFKATLKGVYGSKIDDSITFSYTNEVWQRDLQHINKGWYDAPDHKTLYGDLTDYKGIKSTLRVCTKPNNAKDLRLHLFDAEIDKKKPNTINTKNDLTDDLTSNYKDTRRKTVNLNIGETHIISGILTANPIDTGDIYILSSKNAAHISYSIKLEGSDAKSVKLTSTMLRDYNGYILDPKGTISRIGDKITGNSMTADYRQNSSNILALSPSKLAIITNKIIGGVSSDVKYTITVRVTEKSTNTRTRGLLPQQNRYPANKSNTEMEKLKAIVTSTVSKPTTSQPSSSKADENDGSVANATALNGPRGTIYGYANSYADRDVYKIHLQKGDRAVFYTTPHGLNPTRTTMNGNLIMPNKYQKNPRSVSHKEAGKYHVNGFIVEANDIPYTGWYYLQLVATGSGAYKINYFAKPSNEELARQAAKKAAKIKNTNITIKEGHGYLSINKPTSWVYKDVNTYFTFTLPKDAKLTLQATFDRADSKLKVQLLDSKNKLVKNGQVHNYSNFKGTGISTNIDLKAGTYKILANTPHRRSWLALTGSYKVTKVNSSAASTLTQGQKAAIEIIQKD
jgi:hypothetical protein